MSSKMHAAAARCMAWNDPTGLTFEHTRLTCAHQTEYDIVKWHGSLGVKIAPVGNWKGYCKKQTVNPVRKYETALSNLGLKKIMLEHEPDDEIYEEDSDDKDDTRSI